MGSGVNEVTIVATFGDIKWMRIAERAVRSAERQTVKAPVIYRHGKTLHSARNIAAGAATTKWLIFLDADDELDEHYVEAMLAGTGDVRQPSTLGIVKGKEDPFPVMIPAKHLLSGNYLVVSSMMEWDRFQKVGGFEPWPIYEDWSLFIRLWLDGAVITQVPDAILRMNIDPKGRNHGPSQAEKNKYFEIIRNQYIDIAKAKGML